MNTRSFGSSYPENPHEDYPSSGAWFPQGMERTRNRRSLPAERQQPGNIENAARRYQAGRLLSAYMLWQQGEMDIAALRQEAETNTQGWKNSHVNDENAPHAHPAQAPNASDWPVTFDVEGLVMRLTQNPPQQQ